jgi:replicative DNA helicase
MPTRPNIESKLISALVNTKDASAAGAYGVNLEMLLTYGAEYRWVQGYPGTYETQPSVEALTTKFPEFPYGESYVDVGFLADEVKDAYVKRTMVTALAGAGDALRNGDTDEAFQFFAAVQHSGQHAHYKLRNVLYDEAFLDSYDDPEERIEMPWKTLQKCTRGPADGDFWVVAGRLGHGKTWSMLSMVTSALMTGEDVIMFSLEMPEAQMRTRIHAMLAHQVGFDAKHSDLHGRSLDKILYRKLLGEIKDLVHGQLFVYDMSRGPVSTSHVAALSKGKDLAVVDHMGLLHSPNGKRAIDDWREMATISNIMKEIAQVNTIPLLAAAQINREGDSKKGWKPPKVANLAQSDAIGQDADVVITMRQRSKTVCSYSIEKNRHGETAYFHTRFLPNTGDLREITKTQADSIVEHEKDMDDDD